LWGVVEVHSKEVERVLLFVSDAQERARRAADQLRQDGADSHVVEAIEGAQDELADLHRRLMQSTYYAVPETAQKLAV
jgi:hypothetical protein